MTAASPRRTSVSVVVGVYNSAPWIRTALDSVLAQSYGASEVLVVDDGSTDDTPGIVTSYGGIVRHLPAEHRGRPQRNRGILAARGDVIAFLDGDDVWDPRKLELQLALLDSGGSVWATCGARWMDDATGAIVLPSNEPIPEGDILEALLLNNFIVASSAVVDRAVLEEVGLFNESAAVAAVEDWDLWLRIAAKHPLGCVHQTLCTLRLHGDSFLAALPASERVRHLETVVQEAVTREPRRLGSLRRRALANIHYAAGVGAFRQGRIQEARDSFRQTLEYQPWRAAAWGYLGAIALGPRLGRGIVRTKRWVWGGRD